jgi:hypothetical protein
MPGEIRAWTKGLLRRAFPRSEWTFPIGAFGRLGNQLFQIAGTYALAARHGRGVIFRDDWSYRPYFSIPSDWFGSRLAASRCEWAVPYADCLPPGSRISMQDLQLWRGYEDEIRSAFGLSERALSEAAALRPEFASIASRTAVHVRRGDYLSGVTRHRPSPIAYYEAALAEIRSADPGTQVVVFSDDIAWCRQTSVFKDAMFIEGIPDWADLALMTQCEHHICAANSTFSWWGAYLSDDPRPITLWLTGLLPDDFRRIVPPHWREFEMDPDSS